MVVTDATTPPDHEQAQQGAERDHDRREKDPGAQPLKR